MNKTLLIVVIALLAIGAGYYFWQGKSAEAPQTPKENEQAEQVEPINHPLITVSSPRQNAVINTPLQISGQARGQWYFEATFPIELYDGNNTKIAEGYATAQSEWMTTEYVPFTAEINFQKPATTTGKLVLKRSNASGLPENDDQLEIPINF